VTSHPLERKSQGTACCLFWELILCSCLLYELNIMNHPLQQNNIKERILEDVYAMRHYQRFETRVDA
jgi:hypothetical protein